MYRYHGHKRLNLVKEIYFHCQISTVHIFFKYTDPIVSLVQIVLRLGGTGVFSQGTPDVETLSEKQRATSSSKYENISHQNNVSSGLAINNNTLTPQFKTLR